MTNVCHRYTVSCAETKQAADVAATIRLGVEWFC